MSEDAYMLAGCVCNFMLTDYGCVCPFMDMNFLKNYWHVLK